MENQHFYGWWPQRGHGGAMGFKRFAARGPRRAKTPPRPSLWRPTFMHIYTHTYIHPYVRTYVHTYIHTYVRTHIHTCIHTYIHIYKHTYTHYYLHADTTIYLPTYTHRYIHTDINTYMKYLRGGPRYHNHLRMYVAEVGLSPGCSFLTS